MYGKPLSNITPITSNQVAPPSPTPAELSRECPHILCIDRCMHLSHWHRLMAGKQSRDRMLAYHDSMKVISQP